MDCTTVGFCLDDLKWTVDVEIEDEVGFGVICECQLLNLLWSTFLACYGPEFEAHVVLLVHFELSVN